jgi:hypothetical protein
VLEEIEVAPPDRVVGEGVPAIIAAEFSLIGIERYARIEVEDYAGGVAWSNPLFVRPLD